MGLRKYDDCFVFRNRRLLPHKGTETEPSGSGYSGKNRTKDKCLFTLGVYNSPYISEDCTI